MWLITEGMCDLYFVFLDNAGVIVNIKGEMKGEALLYCGLFG